MDTWWYAVDADGRIAVGSTGESGCVLADGASIEISELLARLRGRPVTDEDPDNWDEMEREIIRQGVYLYDLYLDYSPFLSPYAMRFAPEQPIHVDQLAPDLRGIFKTVELENARFGEARLLQLAEHAECIGYSDEPAYLASDGKTIRPVPGREDSFAAFVAELRRDFPQMYDAYVIDGIEKPEHKN
jgi:hypothetical protein